MQTATDQQTLNHNYELIKTAILNKQPLVITEHDGKVRYVSPHAIGISRKGVKQALFHQHAGDSDSGLNPHDYNKNWRCRPIHKIRTVVNDHESEWSTGNKHSRPQTCINRIDAEIAY